MNGTGQGISNSWNERMRLIRLRRKKEKLRFRDEVKILPKWLVWTVVVLYVMALVVAILVNLYHVPSLVVGPPEVRDNPVLASLAMTGAVTLVAVFLAAWLLMLGYVYRDAQRRGMHAGLWTLLCTLLSWPFFAIGFIIYFQVREPLPYPCPRCNNLVGARFNFCSSCNWNLHPSCPQCKREIAETDKFCPYCGNDLKTGANAIEVPAQGSM